MGVFVFVVLVLVIVPFLVLVLVPFLIQILSQLSEPPLLLQQRNHVPCLPAGCHLSSLWPEGGGDGPG